MISTRKLFDLKNFQQEVLGLNSLYAEVLFCDFPATQHVFWDGFFDFRCLAFIYKPLVALPFMVVVGNYWLLAAKCLVALRSAQLPFWQPVR